MLALTDAQIAAAKDNDMDAITAIVQATEDRVTYHAHQYATTGGITNRELEEDLAQEGRIAVWDCLKRFKGASVAQFFTYMDRTVKGAMSDARKVATRQGVSRAVAADFEHALSLADHDPYEAEVLATTAEVMGKRRMTEEMAHAARLSYMGLDYLDAPMPESDSGEYETLGDTIAAKTGIPEDLLESRDFASERTRQITERVHRVLNKMGDQQRVVLMALTGIDPVGEYGTDNDDALSADYDIPRQRVKVIRLKGKDRFAALYARECGK